MEFPAIFLTLKYALAMLLVGIGGVEVSGFFPARARPAALRDGLSNVLIAILLLTLLALLATALWLGLTKLSWPVTIIAGGLALLGAPLAFQLIPTRFWDCRSGIGTAALVTCIALVMLLRAHI